MIFLDLNSQGNVMQYLNTKRFNLSMLNMSFLLLLIISSSAFANTQLHFNNNKTVYLQGSDLTWFSLPIKHRYHEIKLTVIVDDKTLFYPIITLYDQFKNVRSEIKSPINVKSIGAYKEGVEISIPFGPEDVYMSINMPQELVGQQFNITQNQNTVIPVFSNGSTYYVPSGNNQYSVTYTLMDKGFIELALPEENKFSPEYKQNGWYFDLGVNFGGDTIANNPGGDNYKAGGGALLMLGYDWPSNDDFSYQVSTGFRYQGAQLGDGENFGLVSRVEADYDFGEYHLGIGLHLDILSHTKDEFGKKTKIDDSISPFISASWEMLPHINLTGTYMFAEFTDENDVVYKGNQFGLGLRMTGLNFIP